MALAWQRVYDEFGEGLRSFVHRRVRDPDAAADIVQDVFLRIHARIHTLRDEEKVRAWVYRIARNAVNDHYRATRPTAELPDLPYSPEDPADEEVASRLSQSVRRFLDALSAPDREALILTEYEGLTQAELAARLGISVPGAKSRVQRARARLKALLLECCHVELDRRGGVINYRPRTDCCAACGSAPGADSDNSESG